MKLQKIVSTLAPLAISKPNCISLHIKSMLKESWYSPLKILGPAVSHKNELPAEALIECQNKSKSIPDLWAKNKKIYIS